MTMVRPGYADGLPDAILYIFFGGFFFCSQYYCEVVFTVFYQKYTPIRLA